MVRRAEKISYNHILLAHELQRYSLEKSVCFFLALLHLEVEREAAAAAAAAPLILRVLFTRSLLRYIIIARFSFSLLSFFLRVFHVCHERNLPGDLRLLLEKGWGPLA